ncbi:MAG: YlbF family regulator [Firmicutes bacterium]|nr:YlbF family regulator [Bacillota bacterium]
MNVYDHAHALAKAIKSSPEYKEFMKCQEGLEDDPHAKEMLTNFRKKQWELQKQKISGLEVSPEQEKHLTQIWEIISLNTVVKEYLEKEYHFSIMLADMQKIIGDALQDIVILETPAADATTAQDQS